MKDIQELFENSELWDSDFYKRQINIADKEINLIEHYYTSGWQQGYNPSIEFDGNKYLTIYPDVAMLKCNPLYHYLKNGINEKRQIYGSEDNLPNEILNNLKYIYNKNRKIKKNKRLAIFASYSGDLKIHEYVRYYLEELNKVADVVLFISDNYYSWFEINKIDNFIDYACCEKHGEYDFGSYKRGLIFAKDNHLLNDIEEIILCNDSCYGPLNSFQECFEKMNKKEIDFWGLTNCLLFNEHLQSYFLVFKKQVFENVKFLNFFEKIKSENEVNDVILNYEVNLTPYLKNLNYKYSPFLETRDVDIPLDDNVTTYPLECIYGSVPLIKRKNFQTQDFNRNGLKKTLHTLAKINHELYEIIINDNKFNFENINKTTFSIIVYNSKIVNNLRKALDSILNQTHKNYEIIIVANENCEIEKLFENEIYKKLLDSGNLSYYIEERFADVPSLINKGLENAKNDWLLCVDTASELDKEFLENVSYGINFTKNIKIIYTKYKYRSESIGRSDKFDYQKLSLNNYINLSTFVFNKNLFKAYGGFDKNLKEYWEHDFILRYTRDNNPLFIPMILLKCIDIKEVNANNTLYSNWKVDKQEGNKEIISLSTIILNYEKKCGIESIENVLKQEGPYKHEILYWDESLEPCKKTEIVSLINKNHCLFKAVDNKNIKDSLSYLEYAIEISTGNYITFYNVSDYWYDLKKNYKQLNFLLENNYDFCFCSAYNIDEKMLKLSLNDIIEGDKFKLNFYNIREDLCSTLFFRKNFNFTFSKKLSKNKRKNINLLTEKGKQMFFLDKKLLIKNKY